MPQALTWSRYIGSVLLGGERSEYGKKIVATLSTHLSKWLNKYERRKLTASGKGEKLVEYFYEAKDDGDE